MAIVYIQRKTQKKTLGRRIGKVKSSSRFFRGVCPFVIQHDGARVVDDVLSLCRSCAHIYMCNICVEGLLWYDGNGCVCMHACNTRIWTYDERIIGRPKSEERKRKIIEPQAQWNVMAKQLFKSCLCVIIFIIIIIILKCLLHLWIHGKRQKGKRKAAMREFTGKRQRRRCVETGTEGEQEKRKMELDYGWRAPEYGAETELVWPRSCIQCRASVKRKLTHHRRRSCYCAFGRHPWPSSPLARVVSRRGDGLLPQWPHVSRATARSARRFALSILFVSLRSLIFFFLCFLHTLFCPPLLLHDKSNGG